MFCCAAGCGGVGCVVWLASDLVFVPLGTLWVVQGTITWQVDRAGRAGSSRIKKHKMETARILPEPKMTGTGRYVNRRRSLKGRRSRAAPEMAWFALTLLHTMLKRNQIGKSNDMHRTMLNPFLALLVKYVLFPVSVCLGTALPVSVVFAPSSVCLRHIPLACSNTDAAFVVAVCVCCCCRVRTLSTGCFKSAPRTACW